MIAVATGAKVYLATKPVSMRYGFDGLAALVGAVFKADPYSGHLFLFRSKSAGYLKALYWDGSGLCLFAKRLERGRFIWPPLVDGGVIISPAQLALLIEGMDWRRTISPAARVCRYRHKCWNIRLFQADFSWPNSVDLVTKRMSPSDLELPESPEELRAFALALQARVVAQDAALASEQTAHQATLSELAAAKMSIMTNALVIEKLKMQLARLKRMKSGNHPNGLKG